MGFGIGPVRANRPSCPARSNKRSSNACGMQGADAGLCTLRGKDAQRILADEFGVNYSLGDAIGLGLSCLKPRLRHRKNDPEAMRQWVQDAPLLSKM